MTAQQLRLRHLTPQVGVVLVAAAGAWLLVVSLARHMGAMPGTMGLGIAGFVGVWTLMMTAMMLPSVTPLASIYARSVTSARSWRLGSFSFGYLTVWALAGLPAYAIAAISERLAEKSSDLATATACVIYLACGLYQLTPLKDKCLVRCRSPLALLLRYGSYRGVTKDLRVGLQHGSYCLGCCWMLMALLVVFGVMNVSAMVVLAIVVLVEKASKWGKGFSRLVGTLSVALAVAVIWLPALAPGLQATPMTHMA